MATQDFTTYTESDPAGKLTVTASKITFTTWDDDDAGYVLKDFGANHFAGDYEHLFKVYITERVGGAVYFETLTDATGQGSFTDNYLRLAATTTLLYIRERYSGTNYSDTYAYNLNTAYYIKKKRDEAVGTYGTLYGYIYSDAARTNLLDTLSLALHAKVDFRYLHAINRYGSSDGEQFSGYIENLDLQESSSYNEAAAIAIGLSVAATRLVDATRTATTAIGLLATASRIPTYVRTATVAIGHAVTASFIQIREAAVAIGLSTTATRTAELARTATVAIGHAVTASRLVEIATKAASTAIGLSVTATRLATFARTASVAIGHKVTASRVPTYVRTASVAIGLSIWANCTQIARVSIKTVKLMGLRSIDFIIKKRDAKSGVSKKDVEIGL